MVHWDMEKKKKKNRVSFLLETKEKNSTFEESCHIVLLFAQLFLS